MDAAEPPRIVFENPAQCKDGERAEELLRRALGPARSVTRGWTVTLHVTRTSPRTLRADGAIDNERGARVAHRMLFARGPDCAALADGVGVWASLVLDAETRRPRTAAAETQPAPVPVAKPEEKPEALGPELAFGARSEEPGPPPPPPEKPAQPEWFLQHEEGARTLEVGVSGFLMTGAGVGAMVGPSPYVFIEEGHGVFLRPSLAFAQSMTPTPNNPHGTWLGSRFDTCLRMSGTYSNHAGLQVDLCGGTDIGITAAVGTLNSTGDLSSTRRNATSQSWLAFAAVGPSVDLRGELGGNLAVTLRGVFGINVVRPTRDDVWSGRTELALSWSFR